jgi:hypothetical protein
MPAGPPGRALLLHTGAAIGAKLDALIDKVDFRSLNAGVLRGPEYFVNRGIYNAGFAIRTNYGNY